MELVHLISDICNKFSDNLDYGPVAPTPLKFKCHLNIDLSGT